MPAPFVRVDSFFLRVSEVKKAIDWYTNVLNCNLIWQNDEEGFAALNVYGHTVTLAEVRDTDFYPAYYAPLNIFTYNIEEAHKYLRERDVETGEIETLHHVKWFWFKDIDGNRLEACSYGFPQEEPITPVVPEVPEVTEATV